MRNPRLNLNPNGWSSRPANGFTEANTGLQALVDPGFANPSRSSLSRSLHKELPVDDLVSGELQKAVGLGSDLLVNQPWQSTSGVFKGLVNEGAKAFTNFSNNHSDPNVVRMKKYGMLGAGALFGMFAIQSTMGLVNDLWTGKKSNRIVHIGDAFMKWVMGAGLWATALGKSTKFQGMNPILWGTGISMFLSQLKGISSGDKNILARATKAAGVEQGVKDSLDGLGFIPRLIGFKG